MKRFITLFLVLVSIVGYSQHKGLIVENYGLIYKMSQPDYKFETDKEYKIIFDIFTDSEDHAEVNKSLNKVVNYVNLFKEQGVPDENIKAVVILHGSATKNVLDDVAYKRFFKTENPNKKLINSLNEANVELLVSRQSYDGNAFKKEDKLSPVKMAISAMATLEWYQSAGYHIINFN